MIGFAIFAAATSIVPAAPTGSIGNWVLPTDYPLSALRMGISGYTRFRIIIGVDGKPVRCEIAQSSGSSELDETTCSLVMKRAKFHPATDSRGLVSYGTYNSVASWFAGNSMADINRYKARHPSPYSADLEVFLQKLPESKNPYIDVHVGIEVGSDDQVAGCGVTAWAEDAVLGSIACDQAIKQIKPSHITDSSGQSVASVQDFIIRFSPQP